MCKKKKYYIAVMVSLTIALMTTGWAEQIQAQGKYPSEPIRIIVPVSAGGSTDLSARIMADYLKNKWGVPINVVNITGGVRIPAVLEVLKAKPDGYTFLMEQMGTNSQMPVSVKNIPFDIMDRTFVAVFTASSSIYIVNPSSPIKSMKDLEAEIKKDPDNFTWTANASGYDYAMRRFLKVIGVDVAKTKPVMVKGGTEGVTVTTSNLVKLGFCTASSGGPSIKAKLIRPLAIAGDDRHSLLPDVPTTKEAGYENATQMDRFGPSGPANLPANIVEIWERALQEMVKDPSIIEKLEKLGLTVSYQGSRQSRERVLNELQEIKELYGVK